MLSLLIGWRSHFLFNSLMFQMDSSSEKSSTSNMSVSEPNLTASEMSAVSLLETFAAVARRRAGVGSGGGAAHTSGGSSVSSTNSINISRSQVSWIHEYAVVAKLASLNFIIFKR